VRTKLSVNINKVALIRNSRGENLPDLLKFAKDCENFGADGITVHPRPDERHVRYDDLEGLKEIVTTELNIEGYPSERFLDKVCAVKPHQCTLVPDPPGVLTSSEGWDTIGQKEFLTDTISRLKSHNIRVSLFLDPFADKVEGAQEVGTDRIEFYTGEYAKAYEASPSEAIKEHKMAGQLANKLGLGVNAGHDLNLTNLRYYVEQVPGLLEVSIGHAIVSDALYYGISNVIGMYKALCR